MLYTPYDDDLDLELKSEGTWYYWSELYMTFERRTGLNIVISNLRFL